MYQKREANQSEVMIGQVEKVNVVKSNF